MPPRDGHGRRYLLPRERLVEEVRWHPVWLAKPVGIVLLALVVDVAASLKVRSTGVVDVTSGAVLVSLAYLLWKVVEWRGERLLITDRRMIMITGLLTRKVGVMPLRKVTDMTYERPLAGRVLNEAGWGTFVMESAGQDQAMHRIPYLPHPEELYAKVSAEIFGVAAPTNLLKDETGWQPGRDRSALPDPWPMPNTADPSGRPGDRRGGGRTGPAADEDTGPVPGTGGWSGFPDEWPDDPRNDDDDEA